MTTTIQPRDVDAVSAAFPTSIDGFLPPMDEIPDEFKQWHGTKWNDLVSDCFFFGLGKLNLVPKDGIDSDLAWRHVRYCMGSWEPKHEHKEAGCAYLLSLWFTDETTWTRKERAS